MRKKIKVIKRDQDLPESDITEEIVFKEIQKDTIGRSGSSPTWGAVYENKDGNLNFKAIGLYKEYDYDIPDAAYGEKIWSILGKKILKNVRVPNIDVVEERKGDACCISYRLLNNDTEDMIHIRDILYHHYEREELKKKRDLFQIDDILKCVKTQVPDEENYKEIEKAMIQTILLDCVTNNADRHSNNWAIIRNKATNKYELAAYDHSSSLVDLLNDKRYHTAKGWVGSYIIIDERYRKIGLGNPGDVLIEYISKKFPEYYEEFTNNYVSNLDEALEEIKNSNLGIDLTRLNSKLKERKRILKKFCKGKEEEEYEYYQ